MSIQHRASALFVCFCFLIFLANPVYSQLLTPSGCYSNSVLPSTYQAWQEESLWMGLAVSPVNTTQNVFLEIMDGESMASLLPYDPPVVSEFLGGTNFAVKNFAGLPDTYLYPRAYSQLGQNLAHTVEFSSGMGLLHPGYSETLQYGGTYWDCGLIRVFNAELEAGHIYHFYLTTTETSDDLKVALLRDSSLPDGWATRSDAYFEKGADPNEAAIFYEFIPSESGSYALVVFLDDVTAFGGYYTVYFEEYTPPDDPDLVVTSITPNWVPAGSTVPLVVTVANIGGSDSPACVTQVSVDYSQVCGDAYTPPIPVGETAQVHCTVPAMPVGEYYVEAVADFGDVVAESRENNNTGPSYLMVLAPSLPNLRLISVQPTMVVPNQPTQMHISVVNEGSIPAPGSITRLEVDGGAQIVDVSTPSLEAGESIVLEATMPPLSAGDHHVLAWADYGDFIAEDNEYDNEDSFIIWAVGPNLVITSIEPSIVYGYVHPTYEITIANTGNGNSIWGVASLWVDDQYVCDHIEYQSLHMGEETTVTCDGSSLSPGLHTIRACVDVYNGDVESDETDNCLSAPLEVLPTSVHVRADGSGDFPTIQAAIDAVAPGGEVLLSPEVFTGDGNRDLNFHGKDLLVISIGGGMATIDCQGHPEDPHRGFVFNSGETNAARVVRVEIINGSVGSGVGGGIYCNASAPSIEDCVIRDCHADEGGAMSFTGTIPGGLRVMVSGCTLVSNFANLGGALYLGGTAGVEMTNTLIVGNSSYGGAVSVANSSDPTLELNCCDLWGNSGGDYTTAASGQLGIRNNISQDPFFCDSGADDYQLASNSPCAEAMNANCGLIGALGANCGPMGGTVRGVRADGSGAYMTIQHAINNCIDGDIVELADGTYTGTGNRDVTTLGKRIIVRSASGDPLACRIDCQDGYRGFNINSGEGLDTVILSIGVVNGAATIGAGISCNNSSPTLENLRIWDCDATDDGGALHLENHSSPRVIDCTFENNSAVDDGGALFAHDYSSPVVSYCLFEGNLGGDRGGGAQFVVNSFPEVTGCTFRGNEAPNGGGLMFVYAFGPVTECVFVDNVASYGGAAQCYGNAQADFISCTMNGNRASFGAQVYLRNNSSPDFDSCILSFGTLGKGIDRYADDCSPTLVCTDIWANAYGDWVDFISDQLGVNGNFRSDPLFCNVLAGDLTLRGDSACAPANNVACGLVGALPVGCSGSWLVKPDGSGDFATIQEAIDAAAPAETIVLADGIYTGTGNRDLDFLGKAITVRSQSGDAELCVIDCEGSETAGHRGFQMISGESSTTVLENVTITNGWRTYGGGARVESSSPTLRGVVFRNNGGADGGGLILSNANPWVEDCVFEGNDVSDAGGGVYVSTSFPNFVSCVFRNNSAVWGGGGLYNQHSGPNVLECFFEGNTSDHWGGAVHNRYSDSGPNFTRCLLDGNSAPMGGAVYNRDGTTPSFTSCTFVNNSSANGAVLHTRSDSFTNIIRCILAFSLEGAAVTSDGTGTVMAFCSDTYGNAGGDWTGPLAGQLETNDNFSANPVFCDRYAGDFELSSVSLCQPANSGCGFVVGAFDLGCVLSDVEEDEVKITAHLVLHGAVPNPFNPMTTVSFSMPQNGPVEVSIFGLDGKRVAVLHQGHLSAGTHDFIWRGRDKNNRAVASGVYLVRVQTIPEVQTTKIMLTK